MGLLMLTVDGNCAAGGCARNDSKLESAQAGRSEMILRNSFEDRSPLSVPGRVPHSAPVMAFSIVWPDFDSTWIRGSDFH